MAEFETSHALVEAARRAHDEGYRKMDAYSPVPIEELHDALHMHDNRLPKLVLAGGILGGLGGYGLQYWRLGDRVSAERRRTSAAQLADVHSRHVRDDDSCGRVDCGARHAGAEWAAAAVPSGVQRARASRSRAATGSSCASSRGIRNSTSRRRATFLESLGAREVTTVED